MDTTLKPLAAQYDERLRVMFQEWFAELGKKDYSALLEQAFDIFTEMNNYIHAAFRPDEEKAAKLQDDDLDYEMPFRGCLDFNPDSYELREAIASIYTGQFVQKRYPVLSDEYDTTEMMRESLRNRLLEKLQEEYQSCVLNAFMEMDKSDLIWHVEAYLWLEPFYKELREQLIEQDMSQEEISCLLGLENTLNTVFTEYEGSSITDFINDEFTADLKSSFLLDPKQDEPQSGMHFD